MLGQLLIIYAAFVLVVIGEEKQLRGAEKKRQLSSADGELQLGTIQLDDDGLLAHNQSIATIFIHIPKTGGDSFMKDAPVLMKVGDTLKGNDEVTIPDTKAPLSTMAVFIRQPVHHVYSQFLECKYDSWGKATTKNTNFPREQMNVSSSGFTSWLHHFYAVKDDLNSSTPIIYDYFNCYNPWDMQTRFLSLDFGRNMFKIPPLAVALRNLKSVMFVGLTDFYRESGCLFKYHSTGRLSHACACNSSSTLPNDKNVTTEAETETFIPSHLTHNVPPHSIHDLNEEQLKMIHTMTNLDAKVFHLALEIFYNRVKKAHHETGVDVLCGNHMAFNRLLHHFKS